MKGAFSIKAKKTPYQVGCYVTRGVAAAAACRLPPQPTCDAD